MSQHVTDRRTELSEQVHRAILRAALGESYAFDLIPLAVPDPASGGVEIAYTLAISTRSPLVGQGYITITSQPMTWMIGFEPVDLLVPQMISELRDAVAKVLTAGSNGNGRGH